MILHPQEGDNMLKVIGNIGGLVKAAQKMGSLEDLTAKLEYLNGWGEDSKWTAQVEMNCIEEKEASLIFLTKDGEPWLYGGLVYHESDKSWGVHT